MNRELAIQIFRDRERKPAATKMALEWVCANPAAGMVHFLLLLHVDAWAGRHGFFETVQEAIVRFGAIDAEPLWLTLEGDWEDSRIAYAAQAIATLGAWDPVRMQTILTEPVPFPVWGFAHRHATEFQLPEETISRQEAWRIKSHRNVERSDVFRAKRRRMQSWPKQWDLAPRRPRDYPHVVGPGYGAIGGSVSEAFAELNAVAPQNVPSLRPGMARDIVLSRLKTIPRLLPADLVELYQLADGAGPGAGLVPKYHFLPLDEAIEFHRQEMENGLMTPAEFPFMQWNGDEWFAVTCSKEPSATGKVIHTVVEEGRRTVSAKTLTDFLTRVAQAFRGGRFRFEATGLSFHPDPSSRENWPFG
ncbi:MAG: SMI1/KNR4 family protein [Bryobacterales bacterium]|nr:SMI1/KNR4 family protein [Bryobacterales bacterium]